MSATALLLPAIDPEQDARPVLCPWEYTPYALISWWDMQEFSAVRFYRIATHLCEIRGLLQGTTNPDDYHDPEVFRPGGTARSGFMGVRDECRAIGLNISIKCIDDLLSMGQQGTTVGTVTDALLKIDQIIRWEMEDKLFLYIPSERAARYNKFDLFGSKVSQQFPSAAYDIQEAGNCFATNRPTACVFHLMRVLEIGLSAFAAPFNVPSDHTNWHNIIEGIESKIRNMGQDPNKAPDWKAKQEAYSQAASGFMFFKEAWRNYTAHVRGKYTEEQADGIFRNVQAFMHRLAEMGFAA